MTTSFDELASAGETQQAPIRPLFTIGSLDNQEDMLKWLKNSYKILIEVEKERHERIGANWNLYKGAQNNNARKDGRPRTQDGNPNDYRKNRQRLTVNYLYDITESQISRITRYKPAVTIEPSETEYADKIGAKVTKKVLDGIWYDQQVDGLFTRLHRRTRVAGEDYLMVDWNPNAGELSPIYEKALAESGGKKIPLLDEQGNQMNDDNGEPRYIEKPVRTGELEYKLVSARQILLEPQRSYDLVTWFIRLEFRDIDELKADYPEAAAKIKSNVSESSGLDDDTIKDLQLKNKVLVLHLYHKPTQYLAKGRYVCATLDTVLKNTDYRFRHGKLPVIRMTDIDDEEGLHAASFYTNIEGLQNQYNNLSSMIMQNQAMAAYPKWMMPKGACDITALGNDRTVVQFKGAIAPQLVQSNPTSPEVFSFRETIKEEMRQLGGSNTNDRGQPPPGIKAGIALQYLDEQVQDRFNSSVQKHNAAIVELAQLTLETAAQFLVKEDGNLERLIGKDNMSLIEKFDLNDLAKPWRVRIQNASALPDSKAAKTQTIIDLKESFPDLFSSEQVVELLDLGQLDKFNNMASVAIRAAEAENEDLKQGIEVKAPVEFEQHLLHWRVHTQMMQDRSFKDLPDELIEAAKDHLMATESLMYEQSVRNPAFAQQLLALPMFPMLFVPSPEQHGAVVPPSMDPAQQQQMQQMQDISAFQGADSAIPLQAAPALDPGAPADANVKPGATS